MSALFAAALFGLAATATDAAPPSAPKPVLMVLTSHATKGSTGQPTGF